MFHLRGVLFLPLLLLVLLLPDNLPGEWVPLVFSMSAVSESELAGEEASFQNSVPPAYGVPAGVAVSVAPLPPGLALGPPTIYFQNGCAYVVGEVENTGRGARGLVQVEVAFLGEGRGILARESVYINHLNPGEKKPYWVLAPEEEAIGGIEITLSPGQPAPLGFLPLVVEYLKVTRGPGGFLHVTGTIYNDGEERLDFVKVMINFRGAEGQILDCGSLFLSQLGPGEGQAFLYYSEEREGWVEVEVKFD